MGLSVETLGKRDAGNLLASIETCDVRILIRINAMAVHEFANIVGIVTGFL